MHRVVFEPPTDLGEASAPSAGNKRQRRTQASTLVQFPQEVLVYSGDDERSLRNRGRKGRNAQYDVLGLIVLTGCVVRDVADLKATEWGPWRSKHYAHLIADDPEAFVEWSFTDLQAFDKETHGAHKSVVKGAFIGNPNLFVNGKTEQTQRRMQSWRQVSIQSSFAKGDNDAIANVSMEQYEWQFYKWQFYDTTTICTTGWT